MDLPWKRGGRVGRCRDKIERPGYSLPGRSSFRSSGGNRRRSFSLLSLETIRTPCDPPSRETEVEVSRDVKPSAVGVAKPRSAAPPSA